MKILFATSSFKGGGITSYALEVISNYSQNNDFSVIVGDDSLAPIVLPNVKIYRYEASDISIKNARDIVNLINYTINPDVLFCSNSNVVALSIPYLLNHIKVITVSHSLRYIETDIAAISHKYIDSIIALSYFGKDYIDKRFHIKEKYKVSVVYNFVKNIDPYHKVLDEKINNKVLKIVYLGGCVGSKSPHMVFKVLKKLLKTKAKFQFFWVGINSLPMKKFQFVKIMNVLLPFDERLVITGKITRDESMKISKNANILLIPSKREGCPMALIETMRFGVISITSDYKNACQELIKNGYNGYVVSRNNSNEVVNTILKLIDNPYHYKNLYENSLKIYNTELSFNVWKSRMDKIIYSQTNNHNSRYESFNTLNYLNRRVYLWYLNIGNKFHQLVYEIVPSALAFFLESLKYKRNDK